MKKLITILIFVMLHTGFSQWEQCSNGLNGGTPVALGFHGDTVIVSAAEGGLFFSSDNGENWKLMEGQSRNLVANVLFHAGNRLIAGTTKGIFISDDFGSTWSKKSDFDVDKIVKCGDEIWAANKNAGAFLSTDNGSTWTKTKDQLSSVNVFTTFADEIWAGEGWISDEGQTPGDVFFYSKKNGGVWKGVQVVKNLDAVIAVTVDSNNVYIATFNDIYLSTDRGATWTKKSQLPNDESFKFLKLKGNDLFAVSYTGSLYKSTDRGNQWKLIDNIPGYSPAVLVESNDDDIWATTAISMFSANLSNPVWQEKMLGFEKATIHSMISDGKEIWAASSDKVFKSSDNGLSWQLWKKFDFTISCLAFQDEKILVGLSYGNIYRLNKGGGNSEKLYVPNNVNKMVAKGNNIWAISRNIIDQGILKTFLYFVMHSADNGKTWKTFDKFKVETDKSIYLDGDDVWLTTDSLCKSTDNGLSWQTNNFSSLYGMPTCITRIDGKLMAASAYNGIFVSTDNGGSWSKKNDGVNGTWISDLLLIDKNIFAANSYGAHISSDYAASWAPMKNETGLLLVPKVKCGGYIFAGSEGHGAYRTKPEYLGISIGIEEHIPTDNSLSLFPNPAMDILSITCGNDIESGRFEIYNVLGTKILEGELDGSKSSINVQSLAEGAYILRIGDKSKVFVKR